MTKKRTARKAPDAKEAERKKFEKLAAQAAKVREANREIRESLRDDPKLQEATRQALIDDLIRVYNDPCNPFAGFAASRKRYRQLGHYPEIIVEDFFGTHAEFQRAAGLRDKRSESKGRHRSARLHTEQQIHAFAKENVLRFHGRWDKIKGKRGHIEGIVASDLHSSHCDPFARHCFLSAVRQVQPDVVVLNGDAVDFPSISSHPKLPGHFHLSLQGEIDWTRDLLRDIRKAAPRAAIYYVLGNHEYRLVRYLADTAPALASLRALNFNDLFGLDELEVSLVCRSNFLAPSTKARRQDLSENWLILGDCYAVTHGTSCAKFAAEKELARFNMSGTSGHTHRPQVYYHNSLGTGAMSWMSTPMMAHHSDGRDFVWGPSAWNMGFGTFSILPSKRLVSQQIVQVHDDVCFFAGAVFRPTPAVERARRDMMGVKAA